MVVLGKEFPGRATSLSVIKIYSTGLSVVLSHSYMGGHQFDVLIA